MKKKDGYRNYKQLSEKEKDDFVEAYYNGMDVPELIKTFKLTVRTPREIFKERNICALRRNRYTINEQYFKNIDTERKAYWLGYLFADGFIGDEKHNNIVFSQKESCKYVLEQFAKDIEFTGKIRVSKPGPQTFNNAQSQIVVNFSSKIMANDLRKLNMFTCKSETMSELPPIKDHFMRHFVRGYFDGDGSIIETFVNQYKDHIYNKYQWGIIGTPMFLTKIKNILPVKTYIYDSHTPTIKYLRTSGSKSIACLYDYLYENASFYLKYKHDIMQHAKGYVNRKRLTENGINQ